MALRRPGDRAVLLLARLIREVDEATRNPILRKMLGMSAKGQEWLKEAREIVADARAELDKGGAS